MVLISFYFIRYSSGDFFHLEKLQFFKKTWLFGCTGPSAKDMYRFKYRTFRRLLATIEPTLFRCCFSIFLFTSSCKLRVNTLFWFFLILALNVTPLIIYCLSFGRKGSGILCFPPGGKRTKWHFHFILKILLLMLQ